jgi:hypothetical protein
LHSGDRELALAICERLGDVSLKEKLDRLEELAEITYEGIAKVDYNDADSLEGAAELVNNALKEAKELSDSITRYAAEGKEKLLKALDSDIDKGFSASLWELASAKETKLKRLRKRAEDIIEGIRSAAYLSDERKKEAELASAKLCGINDEAFLRNFISVTLEPLRKSVLSEEEEYLRCKDEFEELYAEYCALCELHYLVAQSFECNEASIRLLREEIERVKAFSSDAEEQEYIIESIDEVMRELGYSVIGSREHVKRNGRRIRNELYRYGAGTAVSITYAHEGRISMELGGLDESDRLPAEGEAEHLRNSMESFCGSFKEIEEKLLERGIICAERISLLPPSEEYAQIINVSDYDVKGDYEKLDVKKKQKTKKKPKTMKNE